MSQLQVTNCKLYILFFIPLLTATACSSSPKSLAENHLNLIKSGNASKGNQQYCMPSETLRLHTLKSFQILNSQLKTRNNLSYTEVTAKIDTDQFHFTKIDKGGYTVPEKQVLGQVTLEIWKSDDFYEESIISTANLNGLMKSAAVLTGIENTNLAVPTRERINKQGLCVFLPFEQFDNNV